MSNDTSNAFILDGILIVMGLLALGYIMKSSERAGEKTGETAGAFVGDFFNRVRGATPDDVAEATATADGFPMGTSAGGEIIANVKPAQPAVAWEY